MNETKTDDIGSQKEPARQEAHPKSTNQNSVFGKAALFGGLGVLLVFLIQNSIWEFVAKPGVSAIGSFVFHKITLGSQIATDITYSTAAMDPSSLPSLLVFVTLLGIVLFNFGERTGENIGKLLWKPSSKERLKSFKRLRTALRVTELVLDVLLAITIVVSLLAVNQAIYINRLFTTNLLICTPYISDLDAKVFRSRFSRMTTEAEYRELEVELQTIAEANGISLVKTTLY